MPSTLKDRTSPKQATSSTAENGSAEAMVADCSACRPPASISAIATRPSEPAQKIRCHTGVSSWPPEASMSTTMEPESEEVTKNTTTIRVATPEIKPDQGNCSRKRNNATALSSFTYSASCA